MRSWTDDEIVRGMRDAGTRQRAFFALHSRYGPRLLGFLTRMCSGDRDRAEDLLSRTLYKAYHGLLRMQAPCHSLPRWLYTVAARTAYDEFRLTRSGDPLRNSVPLDEELAGRLRQPEPEPAGPADERVRDAVEEVLRRLDQHNPRYRTLLEMEHVGTCDRSEMAEATGIERKQLAQYLKRARERFVQIAREYPVLAALESAAEEASR